VLFVPLCGSLSKFERLKESVYVSRLVHVFKDHRCCLIQARSHQKQLRLDIRCWMLAGEFDSRVSIDRDFTARDESGLQAFIETIAPLAPSQSGATPSDVAGTPTEAASRVNRGTSSKASFHHAL
jgi:hypothetical protein